MADPIRLALVGAGNRGRNHLKNVYALGDMPYLHGQDRREVESAGLKENAHTVYHEHAAEVPEWAEDTSDIRPAVVAVCDPSERSREWAAEICAEHGDEPAAYESFEAFLGGPEVDRVDAVVVASPNHTHAEIVLPLIEREIDVFCEKPLATTLEDHDRIIAAEDDAGSLLYVGFNARHSPAIEQLEGLLADGAIGRLGQIAIQEVRTPFPHGHYYSQAESGGSLLEKDCHDFDKMNFITGADPIRVGAFGGQHVLTENTDVDDHANVIVEYDDGVKATLDLCLYAPFRQPGGRVYAFRGAEGVIRSANGDDGVTWELFTRSEHNTFDVETTGGHGGADLLMWRNVMRCLQGREELPATPLDAKKASAVALAAERSMAEGRFVEIDSTYDLV